MLASLRPWRYCLRAKVKFWQRIRDNKWRKPGETPPLHSLRAFAARGAAPPLKRPAKQTIPAAIQAKMLSGHVIIAFTLV